jgi:hypothetical protein
MIVQLVVFAKGYGSLEARVKAIEKTLDKGFTCPMHNQMSEELIRIDERTKERANIVSEIAAAVAKARVNWEKDVKE